MKSIRQFRYYGRAAENNYTVNNWPQDYDWKRLYNGNIFSEYSAITKLGI